MEPYAKLATALAILALLQSSFAAARRHGEPCDHAGESELLPAGGMPHRHLCNPSASTRRHGGTPALMTVNGFGRGESGGGGGRSACDGRFHKNREMIVALSTMWFDHGRRCHRRIRITSARGGRSVVAKVVDECDTRRGCRDNVVDSSPAVWRALGLDTDVGVVRVTWSDA